MIGVHPEIILVTLADLAALTAGSDETPAIPVHLAGVGVYPAAPGGGHGPVTVTVDPGIVIVWPPGTAIISAGIVNVCLSTADGSTPGAEKTGGGSMFTVV